MKKEKSPILVISCILLLLTFIVLPPLFRYLIPRPSDITTKKNVVKKQLQVLKCSKYFPEELYLESISVKYKDGIIDTNTISYKKIDQVPEGVLPNTSIKVSDEYNMFNSLKNIKVNNNNTDLITVTIDQELINDNKENTDLINYYQDLTEEQSFYENMGYTCNVLES